MNRSIEKKVVLPTIAEWRLLLDPVQQPALVDRLNGILLDALDAYRAGRLQCTGELQVAVYSRIFDLHSKYPTAGLHDSETAIAIAQFFAKNEDPNLYDAMRFPVLDH